MIYYAQGLIVATQDRPASVVKQFSPANVIVEVSEQGELTKPAFVYEGTGLKARKTVALVSWNDRKDRYKGKIEYVEDRDGIDRYGYRELEVRALGCTSQSQAQRVGRWSLVTNSIRCKRTSTLVKRSLTMNTDHRSVSKVKYIAT